MAETVAGAAAEMIKTDRAAEQDYHVVAEELRKQAARFLVVIDEIDRRALGAEDAREHAYVRS
jgi:Cdc6-like AAA superfamily ATPase